jgi:PKD domain/Invasin, domain 3
MKVRARLRLLPPQLSFFFAFSALLGGVLAAGCAKVSPTAPSGSTVTLSANPSFISSASGTTSITAVVRKASGSPVASGTEVRFTADLGAIDPLGKTDTSGIATVTLRGDGRVGKATVSAFLAGSSASATLAVNIGGAPPLAKSITLQADPPSIGTAGGTIKLLAVVRDASGQPVTGASVTFSSPVGTLRSGGAPRFTQDNGIAIDYLDISATDLSNQTAPFTVTASTPGADGALVPATFSIQVRTSAPMAAFHTVQSSGSLQVFFVNDSTPPTGLTFSWQFGDGTTSTDPSPTHTYSASGTYSVILTATNPTTGQSNTISKPVKVPP